MAVSVKIANEEERKAAFDLRYKAFVIDEGVTEDEEFDALDKTATHIVALQNGKVVGCCRISEENGIGKISRLVVDKYLRRQGISKEIVIFAELLLFQSCNMIVVHAHVYVQKLYTGLSYNVIGDQFVEDGSLVVRLEKQKPEISTMLL